MSEPKATSTEEPSRESMEKARELTPRAMCWSECKINDGPGSRRILRDGPGCDCGAVGTYEDAAVEIALALDRALIERTRQCAILICVLCARGNWRSRQGKHEVKGPSFDPHRTGPEAYSVEFVRCAANPLYVAFPAALPDHKP